MFRNYLTTALRHLRKHPAYAFINVIGLAVGLTCCLLIALYVRDELRYDRHWAHTDRLYRLEQTLYSGEARRGDVTSALHGPALEEDFPEIEHAVRFFSRQYLLSYEMQQANDVNISFTDPDVFEAFSFDLLAGDPATMLAEPGNIVLTQPIAEQLFGDANPVGQPIRMNNEDVFTVSGVVALPENTHIDFVDALVPFSVAWNHPNYQWLNHWGASGSYTYVLLRPGTEAEQVQAKFPEFVKRRRPMQSEESLHLKPISEIRLRPETTDSTGTQQAVQLFAVIGLLVLLIACINYTNLATARGTERVKEIGMRKVLGANRRQLIGQLLGESVGLTLVALAFALLLTELALPFINQLSGKSLSLDLIQNLSGLGTLVVLCALVGMLAGAYPALYLARFRPVQVLKGSKGNMGKGSPRLRQALVVVQFVASIVLLVGTLTVKTQLDFLTTTSLGFNGEQVLQVNRQGASDADFQAFEQRIAALPAVAATGRGTGNFGYIGWQSSMWPLNEDQQDQNRMHFFFPTTPDYLPAMEVELIAGRYFSKERGTDDGKALIVNEASTRAHGYENPEDMLGQHFNVNYIRDGEVVGVVKDFHFNSLEQEVHPIVFVCQEAGLSSLVARLQTDDLPGAMAQIERAWTEMLPSWPFIYAFVDEEFDALYQEDERRGHLFALFAGLATAIACLGLFGLASFAVQQRTKEIGIRKVLGAGVTGLVSLLSGQFLRLVIVAFVVAAPAAFYLMNEWLGGFAYHAAFPWWSLPVAGGAALLVALLAVSTQAWRAATTNPVEALRYE